MEEIFTAERPLKVWRAAILGTADTPGDFRALADATNAWQRAIVEIIGTAESRKPIVEPKGLSQLTDMLATVCDIGPASINPMPLIRCYDQVARARMGHGIVDSDALEKAFNRAITVISRMLHAWAALSGQDEPEDVVSFAYCPNEFEQSIIDAIKVAGRRLTTDEVLKALTVGEIEPNPSSVKDKLAVLRRAQILDNEKDNRGKGFGLRSWTV